MWVTGKLEGEEREKGTEEISETRTENFPPINLRHQAANQEAQSTLSRTNPKILHLGVSF